MICPSCSLEVRGNEIRCPRCRENLLKCGSCNGNCLSCVKKKITNKKSCRK